MSALTKVKWATAQPGENVRVPRRERARAQEGGGGLQPGGYVELAGTWFSLGLAHGSAEAAAAPGPSHALMPHAVLTTSSLLPSLPSIPTAACPTPSPIGAPSAVTTVITAAS